MAAVLDEVKRQERRQMNTPAVHLEYVLIPVFCALVGYTDKAVRRKIQDGVWLEGKHYRKAPDGHIMMNMPEIYKWVESNHRAA